MLDGRADVAVHSAKDLPADHARRPRARRGPRARRPPRRARRRRRSPACRPARASAPASVRRRAQLAALRPDLTFGELRGNIPTRLEQAPRASTRSSSPPPPSTASGSADRVDRAPRRRRRCSRRSGRARSRSSAAPTTPTTLARARRDRRRRRARRGPRRARVPRRSSAAAATCRAARSPGRGADGSLALDALLASLDGRDRAAGSRRGIGSRARSARTWPASLLDEQGGRVVLDATTLDPRTAAAP